MNHAAIAMRRITTVLLVLAAGLLHAANVQAAPLLGVTITDATSVNSTAYKNWTLGYRFNALANTSVVSLGVWDFGNDGLNAAHDVGIWDAAGTLLSSVSVGSGTSALLDGGYRWVDLTSSVSLLMGSTYTVGAYYGSSNADLVADLVAAASVDPRINVQGSVQLSGAGLAFATQMAHPYSGGQFSYGGGNVRLANQVPEPGTLALFGAALVGLAAVRRKRNPA